jgi:hypothetical protein
VVFADENLEAAVREALEEPEDPLTKGVIRELTKLDASERKVKYLSGLDSAVNLTKLWLNNNQISDVSPLASLTKLTTLRLRDNSISNVGPLFDNPARCSDCQRELAKDQGYCPRCGGKRDATAASFPDLTELWLDVDQLIDRSPLASLPNLEKMNKGDFDAYKEFLRTHEYSKFQTDRLLAEHFDDEDPYEMDDEEEPVSDWIKELMMDDEEWMKLQTERLLAERKSEKESNK